VIVLYDNDEKIAPAAATTLVQRGYDNMFMLSGGEYFPSLTVSRIFWLSCCVYICVILNTAVGLFCFCDKPVFCGYVQNLSCLNMCLCFTVHLQNGGMVEVALVSPDGVVPSRMVCVSVSVNLPLHDEVLKFSSGTGSLGGPGKRAING